jgi:hypothetical protein
MPEVSEHTKAARDAVANVHLMLGAPDLQAHVVAEAVRALAAGVGELATAVGDLERRKKRVGEL